MSAFSYLEPDNIVFMAHFIKKVYRKNRLCRHAEKEDAHFHTLFSLGTLSNKDFDIANVKNGNWKFFFSRLWCSDLTNS